MASRISRTLKLAMAGTFFWIFGRAAGASGLSAHQKISYLLLGLTIFIAILDLFKMWRRDRELEEMLQPTGAHGRSHLGSEDDVAHFGLAGQPDGKGCFLGAVGETPLVYRGLSHLLTIAPNAAGKTASVGIPNALSIIWNLCLTDKGGEIALRTWRHRRDTLKQSVAVINAWRLHADQQLPNHFYNPIGDLPALAAANSTDLVDIARGVALILIPDPPTPGENQFFRNAARHLLTWLIIYCAYLEADTGELVCNLPQIQTIVSGSKEDLDACLDGMIKAPEYGRGAVHRAGGSIKAKAERNAKTFESILTEVQNAVDLFSPLGPLGESCSYSDFDPTDLKRKPMTIYIVAPPEKLNGPYGAYAGLIVDSLIRATLQARTLHPRVTFLLDEFANLSKGPLPSIIPALYVGRSYGCQIWPFVQDRRSLERYGAEASAFETQAEVVQIWGIRSLDDAKWIEERAGTASMVTESVNLPGGDDGLGSDGKYSLTLSERGFPVVSKADALQLPDFKQLIIYKNNSLVLGDLIHFRMANPWVVQAATLPGDENEPDLPIRFKF